MIKPYPPPPVYGINSGLAAILTVVIVGAASLLLALNAAILGIIELDSGFDARQGMITFYLTDGCVEETLRRIRINPDYGIGNGTINLTASNGTCQISVTDPASPSNQRSVTITGNIDNYYQTITTDLTLASDPTGPLIIIGTWQEK
jgi:hypothetical protein